MEREYLSILESQRNFDEGPGGGSPFGGGIAEKVGKCTFEADQPRAAKATYTFEYFKLLQDLNHIRLLIPGPAAVPLTKEQREILLDAAMQSPSLTFTQMRKKLGLSDNTLFNCLTYGEAGQEDTEKRKWPEMQSYHKIRQALGKVEKNAVKSFTREQLNQIGTLLTLFKMTKTESASCVKRDPGAIRFRTAAVVLFKIWKPFHLRDGEDDSLAGIWNDIRQSVYRSIWKSAGN
jgi:CRISPR-associated endonuclease Csn1